ncbi:MAG: hypothetical protein MUP70_11985 [Candidatus Aminicenantes bacterium]|nr:hypothetical protein [Candidatus Aminicenantes bacterium]
MKISYLFLAVIALIMIPVAPQIVAFRVKVLKWLGWKSMADFTEQGFRNIVKVLLISMLVIAVILFLFGLSFI